MHCAIYCTNCIIYIREIFQSEDQIISLISAVVSAPHCVTTPGTFDVGHTCHNVTHTQTHTHTHTQTHTNTHTHTIIHKRSLSLTHTHTHTHTHSSKTLVAGSSFCGVWRQLRGQNMCSGFPLSGVPQPFCGLRQPSFLYDVTSKQ